MQTFVGDERLVSLVREKLHELFNENGRDAMREELERYCREVLESAIRELEEYDLARHHLENELTELTEVVDDRKFTTGNLKLYG